MADLDERLNQLLSDQNTVNKILEIAKVLQAQRDSASPEPAKPEPPAPQPSESTEPDLSSLLTSMLSNAPQQEPTAAPSQESAESNGAQSLPPLAAILPQLMQAMSGQGNLVKRERVNLLQAMRPYLKENRLQSIDRALKMANVTKAATSAMHLLGR